MGGELSEEGQLQVTLLSGEARTKQLQQPSGYATWPLSLSRVSWPVQAESSVYSLGTD